MGRRRTLTLVLLVLAPVVALSALFLYNRYGGILRRPPAPADLDRQLTKALADNGLSMGNPAFIRIFKRERILEVWLKRGERYALFKAYPICAWSGSLGPKIKDGDSQSPEGFYNVSKKQLNPASNYYRAFNLGFPNAYDRQLGRTGSALMVHGSCLSAGCYAMTDAGIAEIYRIVETALQNGQQEVPVQIFPFRMTDAALRSEQGNAWHGFWSNLKQGYDSFEASCTPPRAYACQGRCVLATAGAPPPDCVRITGW